MSSEIEIKVQPQEDTKQIVEEPEAIDEELVAILGEEIEETKISETKPEKVYGIDELSDIPLNTMFYMRADSVIFHEGAYPRIHWNEDAIYRYKEAMLRGEKFPAIRVNRSGILVDGYHRLNATVGIGHIYILCSIYETVSDSDDDVRDAGYKCNNEHGQPITKADQKKIVRDKFSKGIPIKEIMEVVAVTQKTIYNWVDDLKKVRDAEILKKIENMWLRCETQEAIAEAVGKSQQTVSDIVQKITENCKLQNPVKFSDFEEEGSRLQILNIWNDVDYTAMIDNLLYYLTEPADVVVDLFGGSGATIDVCMNRFRRYFVSEKDPTREDIRTHDISTGLPKGLPIPKVVLLNAKGEYRNPELLSKLAKELKAKWNGNIGYVVFFIAKSEFNDNSSKCYCSIASEFVFEMKFSVPAEIDPSEIEKARASRKPVCSYGELVVFRNEVKSETLVVTPVETPMEAVPEPEVKEPLEAPTEAVPESEVATEPEVKEASAAAVPETKRTEFRQPTKEEMLANSKRAREKNGKKK